MTRDTCEMGEEVSEEELHRLSGILTFTFICKS